MKKALVIFSLLTGVIAMAQQETVLSPNGEKVVIYTNPVKTADNGVTASTPHNLELGGTLNKPTTLATSGTNTLSITGLQTGTAVIDNVIISDANGVLRTESQNLFKTEAWLFVGGNTPATANTQSIYQTGNVGIGINNPSTKLHIKSNTPGAIKIQDGTQTAGAFLTSDANGTATWKKIPIQSTMIKGMTYSGGSTIPFTTGGTNNILTAGTSNYITLTKGKWIIYLGFLVINQSGGNANRGTVARLGFAANSGTYDPTFGGTVTYDSNSTVAAFNNLGGLDLGYMAFCTGTIALTTTAASTQLCLWNVGSVGGATGGTNVGMVRYSSENYLYAIKVVK